MLTSLDIGKKLKALRTENNFSQTELATKLNIGQDKISRLEQGKMDFDCALLANIAELFNVSSDYLLGLTKVETALKTDTDTALRISSDYTGLDEEAIKILHSFDDDTAKFVYDMIYFANDNQYTIPQFFLSKKLLLGFYNNGKPYDDAFDRWKSGNEEYFVKSQFRLQSAFNRYINNDDVVSATRYFDEIENEFIKQQILRNNDLDKITEIANNYNFEDWFHWLDKNRIYLKDKQSLKEWLFNNNLIISDDTADYIMLMLKRTED